MMFDQLANNASVEKTSASLRDRGYEVTVVKSGKEALSQIKTIIPQRSSVMNGSSVTLEQIGYVDYLASGKHEWADLKAKVNAENEKRKRDQLRRESVLSDYYLGSVHALAETGEFTIASNTGSQLPHIVFTSPNLIFVVSTKKIVATVEEGMKRLMEYVVPLEEIHMQQLYKVGTAVNKIVVFRGESKMIGRKIRFILVEEKLGF